MRRLQFGIVGSALSAMALSVFLAGCSKDKEKEEAEKEPVRTSKPAGPKAGGQVKFVEGKGTGTLKGKITAKGDYAGALGRMTETLKKRFAEKPEDEKTCAGGGPAEVTEQVYRIGANKQVGNVVVWLTPTEKNTFFKIDPKQVEEAKAHPLEVDQPHCAFLPHVATMFPGFRNPKTGKVEETGQMLVVHNSAPIAHNTNWSGGNDEPKGNRLIPAKGKLDIDGLVPDPAKPLSLKCDIHKWMDAWVWLFDHPYATVSKSDTAPKAENVKADDPTFGTYEIKGVPTGVKLRVVAWHEAAGFLTGDVKGEEIELKDGDNTKDFELEVKP